MSMSNEELEKTGILKMMFDKADEEEMTLEESLEEFEEKIDYLNVDDSKKEKYKELVKEIKVEKDEKIKQFLFKQLIKTVGEE